MAPDRVEDEGAPSWMTSLCGWIDANLGRFLPARCEGHERAPFERYKAVGELAMALYAIAPLERSCRTAVAPLIARVGRMLDDEALAIDWDLWREAGTGSRFHAISLTPFVLLAALQGRSLPQQIADAVAVSGDARIMDLYLLRTVLGLSADPEPLVSRMAQIAAQLDSGAALGAPALYDLTHTALYLSVLGRRIPDVPQGIAMALLGHLTRLMQDRLRLKDYDLAAELLVAYIVLRGRADTSCAASCRELIAAINEDGSVAGPPWMCAVSGDDFEASYHTTLVVLMALCFGDLPLVATAPFPLPKEGV